MTAALARPGGGLAMVAMDQRESLRTMFRDAGRGRVDDAALIDFKLAVARALAPLASAFLIDRHFGFAEIRRGMLPERCGLILAADALVQPEGGPVEETALDEAVLAADCDLAGVAAVKLLVVWRRDERRGRRVDLARRFIDLAARRGLLSVLEAVVRPTPRELADGSWDAEVAIREAAAELSGLRPSIYKAQVPRAGKGRPGELHRSCASLNERIVGPWVVLSQGVASADFPIAVEAACRGGASGFLAGRALWGDVVGRPDVERALCEVAVPRMRRLVEIVDREARG